MKRSILIIQLLLIFTFLMSGCWSSKEPKDLSMVNSVLYDMTDGGKNQLIVEIMNPTSDTGSKSTNSVEASSVTLLCQGTTMPEAIREETKTIDKVLFGGLNKVRMFSERLSRHGLLPILDYLSRDHLVDETPLMIVIDDPNPARIYDCETGLSNMVGNYFDSLSKTQHKSICQSVFITMNQFTKTYYEEGQEPVMGLVKIVKAVPQPKGDSGNSDSGNQNTEKEKYNMCYEGLAAFKDDKLVGFMDAVEARAYNIIVNDFTTDLFSVPSGEDFTTVIASEAKTKTETEVNGENITIILKVQLQLNVIQGGNPTTDISDSNVIKMFEEVFNSEIEKQLTQAIKKAQIAFESDIFGFGCSLHAQHPKDWQKIKNDWNDYFQKAKINVIVDSSITKEGEIIKNVYLKEQVNGK